MRKIQMREATKINKIAEPWLPTTTERMSFEVVLSGGKSITIAVPLGAAVEIEEAGFVITAN